MSTGSGTQEGSRLSRSPLPTAPGTDGSPEIAVEPARVGAWPAESPGCHYHVSHPFLPEWLRTRERGRARVGIPRGRGARPPSFPPLLPPSLRRSLAAPPLPAPSPAGSGRWVAAAASGRAAEDAPPAPPSLRPRSRAGRGCCGARVPGSASQVMGEGGAVGRRRPFPGAPRRRWWRRQQQQQRQRQQEPSWPALLASMGESSPAAQAPRLLAAASAPALPPSPGAGGGGQGSRGSSSRGEALVLGHSAQPVWRLETCYPQGASSGQCFTVESADAVCARNWSRGVAAGGEEPQVRGTHPTPLWNLSDFYLSFCNSYTLWELFSGLSSPNTLNCSLDVVLKEDGEMTTCRQCVEAYQDYDHHAQEKYEEFESVLHKYLQSEEYSVKSCPEDCKVGTVDFPHPCAFISVCVWLRRLLEC